MNPQRLLAGPATMTRACCIAAALLVLAVARLEAQGGPRLTSSPFMNRTLASAAGSAAGFVGLGYLTFAVKGGPEGCDLCWEVTAAALTGSVLGAAAGAWLAGGDFKKGLGGALLGTVAGLATIGILDQIMDAEEAHIVIGYTVPQSLFTAAFSGR